MMKKEGKRYIQLHFAPEDSIDFIRTMRNQILLNDTEDKDRDDVLDVLEDIDTMLTIVANSVHCVEEEVERERERQLAETEHRSSLGMMFAGKKGGVS